MALVVNKLIRNGSHKIQQKDSGIIVGLHRRGICHKANLLGKVTAVSMSVLFLLASCSSPSKPIGDLLTQKPLQKGKTIITISTKYAISLDGFEQAAEEKFPNLDLVQVGNHTVNYSEEYAQQLANDDLTDIIVTWPLDKAAQNCENELIDLSGKEFTSRYMSSMLNSISQDGKLYYLPGPTPIRGIVFNKTMFEKNGWSVPTNFEEFIAVCKEIEASGVRPLQLGFKNQEVLRYAFAGFGYGDSFSAPTSAEALKKYNQGQGSLGDFALPAFDSFEQMIAAGVFKPQDLSIPYHTRWQMFCQRECAMISDGFSVIPMARATGLTDELALMPFFCEGEANSWGHLIPVQYIGLNKNLEKNGNKKKLKLALQLMDFISTPEGQVALSNNDTTTFSSLIDSPTLDAPELTYIREIIETGRCAVFPTFTNVDETLYQALAAMLRGEMTRDEAIAMVDAENKNPKPPVKAPAIGTAAETFSLMETGNYVTDVLRAKAGTDFALFLDNGKDGKFNARGISAKLYKGDIVETDVTDRVLPLLQHSEEGYLNIAMMTGADLLEALEYTLDDGDWFYYFSGLKMQYDPTLEPGSRTQWITDTQGQSLQPDKQYTVAIMEGSVDESYITSLETTELLIRDLVIGDILEKNTITPAKDGRLQF